MTNEKDDLEQLLASAGWLRFLEYARQAWKEQLPGRLIAATGLPEPNLEVRRVAYAAEQINQLLSWPKERIARLSQPETATTFSRGGYDTTAAR